ncbi:MAG: hypothetical protein H0W72_12560, partial [Planctomycetes bacterium]|nr:hypothetical protein [Planctomycetota bacterium]
MTRAVPRRRITDRSLQLLALALVCYGVTYAGYRLIFGIHDSEPMVAIAREAQVVLEALPPQHDLRSELGDLTRQAAALARGELIEEAKPAAPVEQRPDA